MKNLSYEKIWEQVASRLGESLAYTAFESWIKPIKPVCLEEKVLKVSTNSNLSKEWILKNYKSQIIEILHDLYKKEKFGFELIIDKSVQNKDARMTIEKEISLDRENKEEKKFGIKTFSSDKINEFKSISSNLNLKYTFKNFIIG
ncbi:MAG: DnaA N-terminal domain-containing protein, partial [Candidatus Gastranaerophilales bacterium]|nr:DnaA N-terminal domain-containing protein [Candidatus Gastranaerophilales bacterium]